jgi:hypothetical protein
MEDPDQVLLPSCNLIFVVLGKEESKDSIPFASLDDLLLYLSQGSANETSVSVLLDVRIVAHVFRVPIASKTGRLSSSNRLPFNLW